MIKIRPAEIEDLNNLRKLNERIFVDNPKYDDDLLVDFASSGDGEKYFKESIERKDGCCFIAEDNGDMVGYINGGHKNIPYRRSRYFEVDNLGVVPEQKGKGIGKLLMQKVTEWAKENGYQRIYLNVYAKNIDALGFYRKLGFKDIDICLEKEI